MKLLRICALLVLLITKSTCCEVKSSFNQKIKNGYVEIDLINNKVLLSIKKFDGAKMQNFLITTYSTGIYGNSTIEESKLGNSVTNWCIYLNGLQHTKIKVDSSSEVVEISREIDDPEGEIIDCYQLADNTQWFGGPQMRYQHWPIQGMYFEEEPYVTTHPVNIAIAERYWLSSRGIYIYASDKDPLFIDQNNVRDKHLCLIAKNKKPYPKRDKITLNYEIGLFADPKLAHRHVIKNHFGKPTGHPNAQMVEHPIWSTWAQFKININEAIVSKFAKDIKKYGFNNSQIEIDDNWETCYGSAEFDPVKFPDVPAFIKQLKDLSFHVTLWTHPFINENCEGSYVEALNAGYLVKNEDDQVHTTWWQGKEGAGIIDFTNKNAVDWWLGRLDKIKALGIDSFKFDAGETSWLPQVPKLSGPKELQPGIYTRNYTTQLADKFDDRIEVRVGWGTQKLPIFVRMIDKDTRYTWNNGLPTLITTLLQMNLNGYVFVLPDMIGGNGHVDDSFQSSVLPPKDMFIRWLQANVFMPSLQFSFVPWQYDNETIEISKKFTKLHAEIAPKIVDLMKLAVKTGDPINPPIWWVDPLNVQAHKINDEFLLGEEYLVAPVIEANAIQRDIYLPTGKWRDALTKKLYAGPILLKNYRAPLDTLPYFRKEQ